MVAAFQPSWHNASSPSDRSARSLLFADGRYRVKTFRFHMRRLRDFFQFGPQHAPTPVRPLLVIFVFVMGLAGLIYGYISLTFRQDDRPSPPDFALTQPTSKAAAYAFVRDYSKLVEALVLQTPCCHPVLGHGRRRAQERFAYDGTYLARWMKAGKALFSALNEPDCLEFVRYGYLTWRTAYPIKMEIKPSEWIEKKLMELSMQRYALICLESLAQRP